MAKLDQQSNDFLRLILRSEDVGDGWRQCAPLIYRLFVRDFPHSDLIEADEANMRVRLSVRGQAVTDYL